MQLTDGAARLAAMTGSLLTKEEMIFRISFAYCRLFLLFLLFFLLDGPHLLGLSFMAFCLWMRISPTLVKNLFYFLPLDCIRVIALESKKHQLGYLSCLYIKWLRVLLWEDIY